MSVKNLVSEFVKEAPPYVVGADEQSKSMRPGVTKLLQLATNENPFGTSPKAAEAICQQAPLANRYPDVRAQDLRKKLAEKHGLSVDEVMVTEGATAGLGFIAEVFIQPGDEIILTPPTYPSYYNYVKRCRGKLVEVPLEEDTLTPDFNKVLAAITDKTKAIILTSPNNPTGCMYTKETLDAIHDILKDKPIFVLCDDVYRTLTYTDGYHSFSEYQDMRDRIIVIQSFSKPYAMTGWRLGYCMADAKLMDRIQVFHQYCVTSVPSFVQRACVKALETDTSDVVEIFRKRRDYVYQRLIDMGLDVEKPEGAFYMFVDIRKFGMDSNTFCTRMLKEGLVGVIPGIHFGTEGFMRLSYCYSDADLKEGLDRIEKFIQSL